MRLLQQLFSYFCLFSRTNPRKYCLSFFSFFFFSSETSWSQLGSTQDSGLAWLLLPKVCRGADHADFCTLLYVNRMDRRVRKVREGARRREGHIVRDYKINWNPAPSRSGSRAAKSQISSRQNPTSLGNFTMQDLFFNSLITCHTVQQAVHLSLCGGQAVSWLPDSEVLSRSICQATDNEILTRVRGIPC